MAQTTSQSLAAALSGLSFRNNLNTILAALFSASSGATAPSPTVGGQFWLDTGVSPPVLRMRNTANTAWLEVLPETLLANTLWGNPGASADKPQSVSMTQLRSMLGFSQVTGGPRRLILPGGMILQGGVSTTGATGATLTFPLAFSASPTFVASALAGSGAFVVWNTLTASTVAVSGWVSNTVNANLTYHWLAFGE